jgi:hypothetical protein
MISFAGCAVAFALFASEFLERVSHARGAHKRPAILKEFDFDPVH